MNIEKLRNISKEPNEDSILNAEYRKKNRKWLKKSQDIALPVLEYLYDNNLTKYDLSYLLGKDMDYVNDLISGKLNLTLMEISEIESALNIEL